MATGARSPYICRSVPSSVAVAPETTKSMPATVMVWVVCSSSASTTEGAARSATSRMAPGPLSTATASRSTVLASRATTRTRGLACRASSANSRFTASSSATQTIASAISIPAARRPSGDCSVTTLISALLSSSMIRIASASSPQTM